MIGLSLLAAHLIADFPLQTDQMAARKLDDSIVRAQHVAVHILVTFAALLLHVSPKMSLAAASTIGVLHFAIDVRRWAEPKQGFEIYPIAVDQSLHVASLAVVGGVLL